MTYQGHLLEDLFRTLLMPTALHFEPVSIEERVIEVSRKLLCARLILGSSFLVLLAFGIFKEELVVLVLLVCRAHRRCRDLLGS